MLLEKLLECFNAEVLQLVGQALLLLQVTRVAAAAGDRY
jgi:hypothetical protein